jgi:hypothetical protein
MLSLLRYPGQSIIFEYGNTLELVYKRCNGSDTYEFDIYVNNVLKQSYKFIRTTFIDFEDDNILFKFRIEPKHTGGVSGRRITIWCPDFVDIRRKELPPKPRRVK